jgi:hypothetical protein
MPRLPGLPRALRKLFAHSPGTPVTRVAERLLQLFSDHGVEAAQIPRLLPELKLDDLQSPPRLLAALTPALLDQAAQLFGIRIEWLEGIDEEIYPYLATYKQPRTLLDHLASICTHRDGRIDSPLRVLTTTMQLDSGDDRQQLLAPILVEAVADLGNEQTVHRYHPYRDGFDWGYAPTRIELKAIAWLAFHRLGITVPLFQISRPEMDDVLAGRIIPSALFRTCLLTTPSLEDFVLTDEESRVAKETGELPAVHRYLADSGLAAYDFAASIVPVTPATSEQAPVAPPAPITPPEPITPGKQQTSRERWQKIEAAAIALWAQDKTLRIAEVARRIRALPEIKAAALQLDTIHRRIAQHAPPDIKGKPGRKPRQSG